MTMGSILLALFDKFKCRGNNGREKFKHHKQTFPLLHLTKQPPGEEQNYKKNLNYMQLKSFPDAIYTKDIIFTSAKINSRNTSNLTIASPLKKLAVVLTWIPVKKIRSILFNFWSLHWTDLKQFS